jgi:glycosyltransferase involved in cell wall biosynthesis
MNQNPKVSVMTLCYNQAHFIRETLDSVLAQDYDNLEIVVADDASTDGSQDILREYAARYPGKFVLVMNERNLGITGNCNAAFFACTGEFIAILGGDDLFLPGKLSAQVEEFEKDPDVALCYHPVEIFNSATNRTLYITNQNPREDTHNAFEIIMRAGIPGASSVMVRRPACPPGGFDVRLPTVSDWLFYIEVALRGKIVKVDRVLGRYRKHGSGASDRSLELLEESLLTLDLVLEKYPGNEELAAACRIGKARYLAGEAYRQFSKNVSLANELLARARELDPQNWKYRLLFEISRCRPLAKATGALLRRTKYMIKRYLA